MAAEDSNISRSATADSADSPIPTTTSPPPMTAIDKAIDVSANQEMTTATPAAQQPSTAPALETTPATPISPPHTSTSPAATQEPAVVDPAIASLVAIFPTFDHDLLRDILNQCSGNEDQAVDILLGMSDPTHVPSTNVAAHQSQTDLDAQLAERLMLEEQSEANAQWQHQAQHDNQSLPYVPRQNTRRRSGELPPEPSLQDQFKDFFSARRPSDTGVPSGGERSAAGGGGINTAEIQEEFKRMTDTGKKTFNNLFGKVKAKLADLNGPPQPDSGSNQNYAPRYEYSHQEQPLWNQGSGAPQPQTWEAPSESPVLTSSPTRSSTLINSTGGYSIPPPQPIPVPQPTTSRIASTLSPNPTPAPAATISQARPTSPGPPAALGVDRSKLGLMPKRPVSLISPRASMEAPPATNSAANDGWDEDDDLYATSTTTLAPGAKK